MREKSQALKTIVIAIILLLLITLLFVYFSSPKTVFKDENLEAAVRLEVGNDSKRLTTNELNKIETLEASNQNIKSIAGIEKLTNLKVLDISNNDIKSIEQLKDLKKLT